MGAFFGGTVVSGANAHNSSFAESTDDDADVPAGAHEEDISDIDARLNALQVLTRSRPSIGCRARGVPPWVSLRRLRVLTTRAFPELFASREGEERQVKLCGGAAATAALAYT